MRLIKRGMSVSVRCYLDVLLFVSAFLAVCENAFAVVTL